MIDMKASRNKYLSLDERIEIQECLDHGMTFKAIGRRIGKDRTTVSKEVKKHLTVRPAQSVRLNEHGDKLPHEPCPLLLKAPFACGPRSGRSYGCREKTSSIGETGTGGLQIPSR